MQQSATEKLRLHWSHWQSLVFQTGAGNPQLKSCGSIEATWVGSTVHSLHLPIRNWKVAAPLKPWTLWKSKNGTRSIRNWKVAAPLKLQSLINSPDGTNTQSATEKLRLHWSTLKSLSALKCTPFNPQLKSCGSIEAESSCTIPLFTDSNPQLKSCGSIEAEMNVAALSKLAVIRNWKVAAPLKPNWYNDLQNRQQQSATEKLRLHWSRNWIVNWA